MAATSMEAVPLIASMLLWFSNVVIYYLYQLRYLLARGTQGIQLFRGSKFEPVPTFSPESSKICRVTAWSPDGKYFAWANGCV